MVRAVSSLIIIASILLAPRPSGAECGGVGNAQVYSNSCGTDYSYEGCCDAQLLFWCQGGIVCVLDCGQNPQCGWDNAQSLYNCGTAGNPAPGNNPAMECQIGPVDGDGDGWDEDSDCNDANAAINPGASENCNNGVDDDCDGYVDSNDADCFESDDDDASDDDASDDDASDDDTWPFGDDDVSDDDAADDDGPPLLNENPHLGIVCGCGAAGTEPRAALAALALAGLLVGFRRHLRR